MAGKKSPRRGSVVRSSTSTKKSRKSSRATASKRLSKEIEKSEAKQLTEKAKLEKLREQQVKMQSKCPHSRLDRDEEEIYCKDCLVTVGYTKRDDDDGDDGDDPELDSE